MLCLELGENDHIGGWLLCRGARSEGMGWRDALGGGFSEHGVNFRSQASVEKRWNHHKKPTEAAGEGEKTPAEEIEVASTESATNIVPLSGKECSFPVMG